jgi:hypothetical protein
LVTLTTKLSTLVGVQRGGNGLACNGLKTGQLALALRIGFSRKNFKAKQILHFQNWHC